MSLAFSKYEGAGNDFLLVDDRSLSFPCGDVEGIRRLCHRRFGVGADGLILLQPGGEADACMRIFNSDGRETEGCGNGTRCLVRYLHDLGIVKDAYSILVHGERLRGYLLEQGVGIDMGAMKDLRLHLAVGDMTIHFVDSGVPHAVWFVPDVEAISLAQIGPFLRRHPLFAPRGANVNIASLQPDRSVKVRTFERGVEGETLACGTGAVAVAMIGAELFRWKSPVRIRYRGGDLAVQFTLNKDQFTLIGPARKVFEGNIAYLCTGQKNRVRARDRDRL